jgi:hypothetical protein
VGPLELSVKVDCYGTEAPTQSSFILFSKKKKKKLRKIPRLDYWGLSPAPTAQHILSPAFQAQSCTMLQLSSPDSLPTKEILHVRLTLKEEKEAVPRI